MAAISEVNLPVRVKVGQPAFITYAGDVVPCAAVEAVWIKDSDPDGVAVQGKLYGNPVAFSIIAFTNDTIPNRDPYVRVAAVPEPESRELAEAQAQAALDELLELLGWSVEIDYRNT